MNPFDVKRQYQVTFALRRLMDQLKEAPELQRVAQEAQLPEKATAVIPNPTVTPPAPSVSKQLADDMLQRSASQALSQTPTTLAQRLRSGQTVHSNDLAHLLYTDPEATQLVNSYQGALDRNTVTPEMREQLAAKLDQFGNTAPAQNLQPQAPFSQRDRQVANAQTRLERAGDLTAIGDLEGHARGGSIFDPVSAAMERLHALQPPTQEFAEGGDVEEPSPEGAAEFNAHSSLRTLADAARRLDNPSGTDPNAENRARATGNVASLLYGLDRQGNPAFGGRAWTSEQGGTPMGLLDVATALPHNAIGLAKLVDKFFPGKSNPQFWDNLDPQWSQDAATRLAKLRQRVQQTTGVGAAQNLPSTAVDMLTDLAIPGALGKLAPEGAALRKLLPMAAAPAGEEPGRKP